MRWICVNGPWQSNFESSCFFPLEPLLKFQTSRLKQRHFFVLNQNRTNWMVRDFHRCPKHLRAWVIRQTSPANFLNAIYSVVGFDSVGSLAKSHWTRTNLSLDQDLSSRKYSMISLHCKQIECDVSLVVQYANAPCQPYSFAQLNLARYSAYTALIAIGISVDS
jgi:hypothetical protein